MKSSFFMRPSTFFVLPQCHERFPSIKYESEVPAEYAESAEKCSVFDEKFHSSKNLRVLRILRDTAFRWSLACNEIQKTEILLLPQRGSADDQFVSKDDGIQVA